MSHDPTGNRGLFSRLPLFPAVQVEQDMGAYSSKQLLADLEGLRRNDPTILSLNYEHSQLGDEGARELAKALLTNHVLRRLRLGDCNITAHGLQSICRSLCENRTYPSRLRKLELSTTGAAGSQGNPLGDNGASFLTLLVEKSQTLRHLIASSCQIGDKGAVALAGALQSNTTLKTLDLSHNSISDVGVEQIGNALAINKSLKGLSLWNNRLFHSGAEALANGLTSNSSLEWLGLGCNHIGDEGAKALAIALLSNANGSALTWIGLGGNEITDRGVEHFAVALMAQKSPPTEDTDGNYDEDTCSSQASLSEQIRTGGLRPMLELGVTASHVSIAAGEDIGSADLPPDEGDEGDTYCIPLESLGLGGNQITCTGATMLADGLKTNTRLSCLGLADNRISDNGATALAELVRYTDTLQKLVLSGNDIHNDGGSTLIAALSQNTSISGLYLAGNPVGDSVAVRCEEVIGKHNHSLRVLDLHDTRMSTPALTSLVEMMQKQGVLQSLGCRVLPSTSLPPSQNMMEGQPTNTVPYRPGRRFVTATVVPSQRHTTLEALGSLPLPDESAQVMVVKQSSRSRSRRGSISQYIRRKLSKSGGRGYRKQDNVSPSHSSHRHSIQTPPSIELVPLTEEDTQPTRHGEVTSHTMEHSLDDLPEPATLDKFEGQHSPSRLPSAETVERIGGITRTETSTSLASPTRTNDSKPVKEQWTTALRMRVGMLKMGGFLHSGFNTILAADSAPPADYQAAALPCNAHKNRVSAPFPPDHSRVNLQLVFEEVGSDYINASFVGSPGHPKSFIVSQSPSVDVQDDMWRMIWEQRVCVIVVLTNEGEVDQWWPEEGVCQQHPLVVAREWASGPLTISATDVQVSMANPDVVVRTFELVSSVDNERETVTMYQYTAWNQRGVPESITDLANMYHNMLTSRLEQVISSPVLLVSQFGGGRAGCFGAVSVAHELMQSPEESPQLWDKDQNILDQVIRGIRQCRPGLVETQEQFESCHLILDAILNGPTSTTEAAKKKKKKGTGKKWNLFRRKPQGGKVLDSMESSLQTNLLY